MSKIVLLLICLSISGCRNNKPKETSFTVIDVYKLMVQNLDSVYPGRGKDVFNDEIKDRCMAYGLILSSETNRYKHTKDPMALKIIEKSVNWLIDNSDLNMNGIHGYGLADSFDAFTDSSKNPANQEYAITTGIVINGLLDWHEMEDDSHMRNKIENAVINSIKPYLNDDYYTATGLSVYSLNPNDKKFDIFNSSVYLAGQMQRYATITKSDSLRLLIAEKNKRVFDILVLNKIEDVNGNIYWNYGIQFKRPNDLIHVGYIVEGLRNYIKYNGTLNIKWQLVFNHLYLFYSGNKWFEHIEQKYRNDKYNSRLWGLGYLLYSLSLEGNYDDIEKTLLPQIRKYYLGNGQFKYKTNDERKLIRHDAHLLLGLSYYLYNEKRFPESK